VPTVSPYLVSNLLTNKLIPDAGDTISLGSSLMSLDRRLVILHLCPRKGYIIIRWPPKSIGVRRGSVEPVGLLPRGRCQVQEVGGWLLICVQRSTEMSGSGAISTLRFYHKSIKTPTPRDHVEYTNSVETQKVEPFWIVHLFVPPVSTNPLPIPFAPSGQVLCTMAGSKSSNPC